VVEQVLDWVRAHPLPGGRIIPICLWGERGAGKTQLIRTYCAKKKIDFRGFHPAHSTTGADLVGLQYLDKSIDRTVHARPLFLPSEKDPVSWHKRGLIFIDEINRAPKAVLQGLLEPIGEGTIEQSGWKLPPDWGFICAANPPQEGYEVEILDESLMDRLLHLPLGFDAIRWSVWAESTDIPREMIDFNAKFPHMVSDSSLELPETVQVKTTPRSMEYLARLYEPGMNVHLLQIIAEGLIGKEPAAAFIEHVNSNDKPVSGEEVVTGHFHEKLHEHLTNQREDLINASQILVLSTLAGNKFRPGQDETVAGYVAHYLKMLGSERLNSFWAELSMQAPHWTQPIREALQR